MAVCANGRVRIARGKRFLMYTIQHFLILLTMTLLTSGVHLQRKVPRTGRRHFRMWKTGNIRVTVHTCDFFLPMHGSGEFLSVNGKWNILPANGSCHSRILVTGQAGLIGWLFALGEGRG
jgi:hypothetical protein